MTNKTVAFTYTTLYTSAMKKPNGKTKRPRGAVTQEGSVLVAVWLPRPLYLGLEQAVRERDSDRSKIIRNAIRAHVQ